MNRSGRAALLLCLGVVILRLIHTGGFGWFVQQRMRWPLFAAGIVLVALGLIEAVASVRAEKSDPDSVSRRAGPAVGWFMMLPLLVLIAVAPTGLGANAADRIDAFSPTETGAQFPPLPDIDGPVPLALFDFLDRSLWDDSGTLSGVDVVLEGFVVNDPSVPDGFKLTRFMVSCCAADALPLQVAVHSADQAYPDDTWVQVTGRWREPPGGSYDGPDAPEFVEFDADDVVVLPESPEAPYESPF